MVNIAAYFRQYGWTCEEVDPGVWHSTFAVETGGESGEVYDLYVLAADDWVQLALSPLLATARTTAQERLHSFLLHANHDLRLARLALDADGDVNLLIDLPAPHITPELFGQALELMAYYAGELAPQLHAAAGDPRTAFPSEIGD
jgi:hypothetical protein